MNVTAYLMGDPPPGRSALERRTQPVRITLAGSGGGKPKLTEDMVREIRASDGTHKEIAARYGVGRQAISDIFSGRTWKHVN